VGIGGECEHRDRRRGRATRGTAATTSTMQGSPLRRNHVCQRTCSVCVCVQSFEAGTIDNVLEHCRQQKQEHFQACLPRVFCARLHHSTRRGKGQIAKKARVHHKLHGSTCIGKGIQGINSTQLNFKVCDAYGVRCFNLVNLPTWSWCCPFGNPRTLFILS